MILSIKKVKDFGVYQDFSWVNGQIKTFKEKNVVYGWNYSGKTTLSRIFSSLRDRKIHPNYLGAKFTINTEEGEFNEDNITDFPYDIAVFNSDYIRDNLKWDKSHDIDAISFDIGANVEIRDEIDRNEQMLNRIHGDNGLEGRIKRFDSVIHDFNQFEDFKFRLEASRIKNDILKSVIEFNKGHLKRVLEFVYDDTNSFLLGDTELRRFEKIATARNDKNQLLPLTIDVNLEQLYIDVSSILSTTPEQSEVIEILDREAKLYSWVKDGYELHVDKMKTCTFCGNDIDESRFELLKKYFSNAAAKLRGDIQKMIERLTKYIVNLTAINIARSVNDIVESYQSDYSQLLNEFAVLTDECATYIDYLILQLNTKENGNLFIALTMESYDNSLKERLENWVSRYNKLIINHNDFISNFNSTQGEARENVIRHYVSRFLIDEGYFEKEDNYNYCIGCIEHYNYLSEKIKAKNEVLSASLKSVVAGSEELNKYIKAFLSRQDIAIAVTAEDKFVLKRGEVLAENLSEGEKTAISFSYFLATLESLFRESKLQNTIIYIDDPISSLDANHIAHVYSLINSFFFRKGINPDNPEQAVNCFKQMFISTHNFEFFSFLRDSTQLKKHNANPLTGCNYYLIKRESNNSSKVSDLPKTLERKSEYIYLFDILYNYYLSGCSLDDEKYILIPNALRRFFEIYTLTKIPDSTGEVDSRINILLGDNHSLKMLHHFSHFTAFEKIVKHDELILNLPTAMQELFDLLENDKVHYDSLKRAIGIN